MEKKSHTGSRVHIGSTGVFPRSGGHFDPASGNRKELMVVSESLHRARLSQRGAQHLTEPQRRRKGVSVREGAQTLALLLKLKPRLAHLDVLALACSEENH